MNILKRPAYDTQTILFLIIQTTEGTWGAVPVCSVE